MAICGKELLYAFVIMLGPITFGTIMCYPSPAASKIQSYHILASDDLRWSFYNSVSSLFAIGGPFISNGLRHLFNGSRKKTVFVFAIAGTILWLLNLLTKIHIWAGIVVRAFLGFIMGGYSSISPMYLVEIAPEDASGFFGSLNQIGIVIGIVFFDFIGPSLSFTELDYVGAAVTALQAILIWFIPESPACGRAEDTNANDQQQSETPKETNVESLWQKKYMCGLSIGIAMMLFQQFCGINAILTNLAELMNESGLKMDGNYQAGIASCAQLIAVFVGGSIIDKIGRKLVWLISNGIVVVVLIVFALNTKYDWNDVLPLVCIFLYQLGFGLGLGPIPWFLIPEYFDDAVRPLATTIVSASNWIFSFCVIFIWPAMKSGMGMFASLLFFMAVSAASFIFGIFGVHEPGQGAENESSSSSEA